MPQGNPKHVRLESEKFFCGRTYAPGDVVQCDARQAEELAKGGHTVVDAPAAGQVKGKAADPHELGVDYTIDTPFAPGHIEGKEEAVVPDRREKAANRKNAGSNKNLPDDRPVDGPLTPAKDTDPTAPKP